jgi:hypothetical protein
MLLSSVFTFTVGPVLHVDFLSHFLTFVWEKKIEVLVSEYICEINMRKYRIDLLYDLHIFVTQFGQRRYA